MLLLLCGGASALAEPPPAAPVAAARAVEPTNGGAERASRSGPWSGGIGDGLRKGARQAGLAMGPGFGTRALGSKSRHDLALSAVQYGRVMSDLIGEGRWYQGNAEVALELFGGAQYEPAERNVVGALPLLRYSFATGSRWVPFVNGGVGVAYTEISHPDINGGFQFTVQVGAGAHYFIARDRALTLQYRWFHLSNAGMRSPNSGVNSHLVFAGLSWLY